MLYSVTPYGVVVENTIGTFPAYETQAGATVTTDTSVPSVIHVDNWPLTEQQTATILDKGAFVWLPNNVVGKITGLQFREAGTNVNTFKLTINLDVDSSGTAADFNYITLQAALSNWTAKIENQGTVDGTINDTIPILGGNNSVFRKVHFIRPIKLDATETKLVASNAIN